jgi:hypothetical protein
MIAVHVVIQVFVVLAEGIGQGIWEQGIRQGTGQRLVG